jgi:dTDP-4-amino-4,6-dideoxygalactose transaminase
MITPRTTGIIGVHLWGRVCATDRLESVADRHGLALLYDAAHAFGCARDGRPVGSAGQLEVFSFHATKFINAFEGGAVVTNDDGLAERIRLMQNFGFSGEDEVSYIGTNGKMNEAAAAMGLTSLESFDEFMVHNQANFEAYRKGLSGIPGIRLLEPAPTDQTNYQYVVIEVDGEYAGLDRDQLLVVLRSENIRARRYFYPGCHRMEPYRSLFPHAGLMLPHTERVVQQVMALPTGTAVTPEDVDDERGRERGSPRSRARGPGLGRHPSRPVRKGRARDRSGGLHRRRAVPPARPLRGAVAGAHRE